MKVTTDACLFGAWTADRLKEDFAIKNILDIGSGTGLLSLMLAQRTAATIDGIEIQENDFNQSIQNISASPWTSRIQIFSADVKKFPFDKKYDAVISNPPFYENDLKGDLKNKNIAHHNDGLKLQELLHLIQLQLAPAGKFFILLPAKRKNDLHELLGKTSLFVNHITYVQQTEKHSSFRMMVEGSSMQNVITESNIIIKDAEKYSTWFAKLLQPYYLHL